MSNLPTTVWDAAAKAAAASEPAKMDAARFVSVRGGVLSVGGEPMPGNQLAVVVLDAVRENTFYGSKYEPDNPQPPICYAYGRSEEEMAPHPSMDAHPYFQPQSEACAGCPKAQWFSADQGNGKACQERRRLALLPAGWYTPKRGSRDFDLHIIEDEQHYRTADWAQMKLPVTSVVEWAKYVQHVASARHRPPQGVITRIWTEPHPRYQYVVRFECVEDLPDALYDPIMRRAEQAGRSLVQAYAPPVEREQQKPSGFRGFSRS